MFVRLRRSLFVDNLASIALEYRHSGDDAPVALHLNRSIIIAWPRPPARHIAARPNWPSFSSRPFGACDCHAYRGSLSTRSLMMLRWISEEPA